MYRDLWKWLAEPFRPPVELDDPQMTLRDYQVVLDAKSLPPDSIVTSDAVRTVSLRLGATIEEPQFHFEIHKPEKPIKRTFEKQ